METSVVLADSVVVIIIIISRGKKEMLKNIYTYIFIHIYVYIEIHCVVGKKEEIPVFIDDTTAKGMRIIML